MEEIFMLNGAFMPHRLENDSELQGVIERILGMVEKSIPVASHPAMHTLPEYPDAILPTSTNAVSNAIFSTNPFPTTTTTTSPSTSSVPTDEIVPIPPSHRF